MTRRRVLCTLDRTLGDGVGPRSPMIAGVPFGNRGPGGPPAYFWRGDDGSGAWVDGASPVPCGEYLPTVDTTH